MLKRNSIDIITTTERLKTKNMAKILGVGIATLDIINLVASYPTEDSEIRVLAQDKKRGGNATNTLTVLNQLGHQCYWAGTLANEPDSQPILDELKKYNIDTRYVTTFEQGKVPTSYILLNKENGTRSIVHHRDLEELSFSDFKKIQLGAFDWVHFEGRNIEQTLLMLQHLKQHYKNIPCSVEFEKQRDDIEQLYPYVDTLIFSKDYCRSVSGNNPEVFIKQLQKKLSNKNIILAWGETGSYASKDKDEYIFSPAVSVDSIKDTLGAGDTFNAGIINAMLSGHSLIQTLEAANRLAGYKVTVSGFDISGFNA